jgi:hypothetical protein
MAGRLMTKEYPKPLVDAFVACKKNQWDDEPTYLKFKEQSNAYLKGKADESIEHSKLVVELARATMSLFRRNEDVEEETPKKAKATKKLVSRQRKIPKLGGSDGIETKEEGAKEVALQGKG